MGIITLEAMPESVEEMQNFRPDFELPSNEFARQCTMRWTVRPPTLESGVTNDPLHTDWERAKQILSERLSALDEVNQPPKIALFGRKIKSLQTKLDQAMSDVPGLHHQRSVKMKMLNH